jgi:hypothetical protein
MAAPGSPSRRRRAARAFERWWFEPVPRARIAWLRTFLYGFVVLDVLLLRPWVADYGSVPGALYHPLMIGRILPLPTPTPALVVLVEISLLACALLAACGRAVSTAGVLVFALYLEWMVIAFSYGKVDHDRFAFLVALAVLPTIGRTGWSNKTPDENAGWAVKCIQVAVVATYVLSAFAKFRFGGFDWVNGATLLRAVLRRGTWLAEPLESFPWMLRVSQYLLIAFELSTFLLLARGRLRTVYVVLAVLFHAITWLTIRIIFWPHVMCLLAFLPLERLSERRPWPLRASGVARVSRVGRGVSGEARMVDGRAAVHDHVQAGRRGPAGRGLVDDP